VVTANKVMVANSTSRNLSDLQEKYHVSLLYEASAGASIPIIRNLEEYYDNETASLASRHPERDNKLCPYQMHNEGIDYNVALKEAQEKGFAESDPTLDVEGWDAKYKLCIITGHAYGLFLDPREVFHYGINKISSFDIRYAREKRFQDQAGPLCW